MELPLSTLHVRDAFMRQFYKCRFLHSSLASVSWSHASSSVRSVRRRRRRSDPNIFSFKLCMPIDIIIMANVIEYYYAFRMKVV